MSEQLTGLAKMREPFLPHQISKLCRSTKKDNPKSTCRVCGGYHGQPSIALDYVGHAALTDRLLDCDPSWTWEPVAFDAQGYPVIDKDGGMWIKLTVCGVTRYGYGDAQGKTGGDAMKERIGDALRNAAMRFGAALDLWHKGELHVDDDIQAGEKAMKNKQQGKGASPAPTLAHKPQPSEMQAKYFPRIKEALDFLFGSDTQAKMKEIEALTEFQGENGEMVQGVKDYRTLDGKRLQILCHKLESTVNAAKKNAPAQEVA